MATPALALTRNTYLQTTSHEITSTVHYSNTPIIPDMILATQITANPPRNSVTNDPNITNGLSTAPFLDSSNHPREAQWRTATVSRTSPKSPISVSTPSFPRIDPCSYRSLYIHAM